MSNRWFPSWRLTPTAGIPLRVVLIMPLFLLVLGTASLKGCISHHAEYSAIKGLPGQLLLKAGQAFIVDRDGLLITTSTGEPPFKPYVESDHHEILDPAKRRLAATDSQNPLIRAASRYLADATGGFQHLTDGRLFKATLNDQPYFLQLIPFRDANLDWRIVVVVPEADVMRGIHATERQMAALNGAVLILALLLGLWITCLIIRPIRALNADASRLARGDFQEFSITTSITELRQLTDAFKSMATRLSESFSALHELNQALADHQEHLEEIVAQRAKALRLSEIQFRHAFELIGVGMILVSPSGQILRVNNAFCQLLGYSEAELLELNFTQISFPDDLEKDWNLVRQVLSGVIARYQLEKRYVHKQGHVIWCLLNASLVRDSDGQPLYGVGQVQDITECRRMEQALRDANQQLEQRVKARTAELEQTVALLERESAVRQESEERLTLALRAAHAGAWEWNIATGQAFWTDDHYRLMGFAPGGVEVCYEAWLNCVHPDDRAEIARQLTEAVERGAELSAEYRVVWPDGSIHWLSDIGQVQYDPAGQPVVMYGIQIDITDHKRAELALRETETLYRQLVENQPDLICRFLPDTTLTFVNAAYARFFGRTPEELLGKRFIDFLDPPARAEVWRHLAALTPTAPAGQYEHASVRADGITDWHLWHDFASFDDQGHVTGFQSIGVDITALKQSQERTRLFFERQVVGMAVTSPEKSWLQVNDRLCAMLGYSREELAHLTWAELTHPGDLATDVTQFERLLAGNIEEYILEKRLIRKNGQSIHVNLTVTCVRRPNGSVDYLLTLLEDITERKQSQEALYETMTRLEQEIQTRRDQEAQLLQARKLEALGRLTGGIAHDFNNLLTVVKGNLELLRDARQTGPDSERAWLIEDALSAARQGAELTAGLLAFSRQRPSQPKRTRVTLILQGLERLMDRVLGPTITLRAVADPTLPDVLTDPGQFQAALMNLLINAQDAMPDGGVLDMRAGAILVHPGAAPPVADLAPGQYLVVTVADSGIGMDADTLARACEPFFTTKPVGKGTGLGLSTVYGFAAQSQGGLTLESQPGQGTTVRLFLPALEPASGRPAELLPAPRPRLCLPSPARGTETLLVVEDESRVRRLACRYLRELGYTVLEAADAEEALAILETEPEIQLMFSDIVMPGELNGHDLARWIVAHRPEVKCLLTTGYHDRARASPTGDTLPPVLAKPYGKEQLADQIRQQFDNP